MGGGYASSHSQRGSKIDYMEFFAHLISLKAVYFSRGWGKLDVFFWGGGGCLGREFRRLGGGEVGWFGGEAPPPTPTPLNWMNPDSEPVAISAMKCKPHTFRILGICFFHIDMAE